MSNKSVFGSRLYSQIVYPLLAATIAVGIVATVIAVYFLGNLTTAWVEQVAVESTDNLAFRFRQVAAEMGRAARRSAAMGPLQEAAETGDLTALRRAVVLENNALAYDAMFVLDAQGEVVAVNGLSGITYGEKPLAEIDAATRPATRLCWVGDRCYLVASRPMECDDGYSLALCRLVDDSLLTELGVGDEVGFALFLSDGSFVTSAFGEKLKSSVTNSLTSAIGDPNGAVARLVDDARNEAVSGSLALQDSTFALRARRIDVLPGLDAPDAVVVGVVSQRVSEEASLTTTNLLTMWSIVAVVALVGLGGWVARRVSDPLIELSAGARRIADGDFETKVSVSGANEIVELADAFNQMTESLHERSESLTKKVLELATLYEMSRALGSTLDLAELLGSVLDSALRIFGLDVGYITLRDKENGAIAIRAANGARTSVENPEIMRSSMSEWVIREGRPLIFNPDTKSDGPQVDVVTGARAALCVPLISSEGPIGSITIGSVEADRRFNSDDVRLLSTIANHVTIAIGNIELFMSLQEAYLATVRSLAAAVDAKDTYTRGHSDRVAAYAVETAERLGLSHDQRVALEMAAYLHDIGKIGVKEEILLKPGRLDDDEMAQMRHHPLIGASILKPVAFPWAIAPLVRHHHEAWDGTGYPAGLRGEEIPLLARILAVADSFEAMTSDRPYRKGMSIPEGIEELKRCSGTQFDPRVVEVFISAVEQMQDTGEPPRYEHAAEATPEEARAIFAAVVDGIFMSFRRLGGPRLANNIETELDEYFVAQRLPFRIVRSRLTYTNETPAILDGEAEQMKIALRRVDTLLGRVSGSTLVEHFYDDALDGLSNRMLHLAMKMEFYENS